MKQILKIALICGGPSLERGISLNSARSLLDHLSSPNIEIQPIYVDQFENFYEISADQLYSNTPADFDFKLSHTSTLLNHTQLQQSLQTADLVFPVIHGTFGEDGQLQQLLETYNMPFVGPSSNTCNKMFNKQRAATILAENGFKTIPAQLLSANSDQNEILIRDFFAAHALTRAIIKPVAGGSSIGVASVTSPAEASNKLQQLFTANIDSNALLEPFCHGTEFTIIVLQTTSGTPVALIPSEIEVCYENGKIFDYRRKYLPTTNTKWHCPPRFDLKTTNIIQAQAEEIFKLFEMRDFARLDGWVLDDGSIVFSDLNPISGMEQNSFIFQQTSRIGMSHHDALRYIVANACKRHNIATPEPIAATVKNKLQPVHILFGGNTAERQVSLMSGTNVWLKLLKSDKFNPIPYFLDSNNNVWQVPYTYALHHTVEEILASCLQAADNAKMLSDFTNDIRARLQLTANTANNIPSKMSFNEFLTHTKAKRVFLFIALHGGAGENGTLQQQLDDRQISYNGSGPAGSALCMDKYQTGLAITAMQDPRISTTAKIICNADTIITWDSLLQQLQTNSVIIKPQADGCSSGVVRLQDAEEFQRYMALATNGAAYIPEHAFSAQHSLIEMPQDPNTNYIIEPFIETDIISIDNNEIIYDQKTGWLELTVGVLEKSGNYHAFNPSITIAAGTILSLEEKFQGGTGINITPPPEYIITATACNSIKQSIEKIAATLNINNYARIDLFYNVITDKIIVIEANTLPGLTAATVLYQQALAEKPKLTPTELLETIINYKQC
ncbi:MAG: hypothetical protein COC15_04065 [Legionellales bacterium]|nr:MAG: hypothetical protein COC15_04065 [Legionellales bacterium]